MSVKSRYPFLERLNLSSLYNIFLGLPPERQTLAIVGGIVALSFIILLPISLSSSKISNMEKLLGKHKKEMGDIVYEIEEYDRAKTRLEMMTENLKTGFDTALSTTLESAAGRIGIQGSIESLKEKPVVPTELFDELAVEVRLSKVTLEQLIDFLHSVENDRSKLLRVKDLRMKTRFDNKQLFDVSFQVSTYRLQEG